MATLTEELWLHPHVYMARCGPDIVVLDVRADEYALLVDVVDLIRPGRSPGLVLTDPEVRADLEALDLVAAEAPPSGRAALPDRNGEIAWTARPVSSPALAAAAWNGAMSTAAFRGKSLAALVALASRPRRAPTADDHRASRAVGAFQSVLPWLPFEGDCLQRGFMLHFHLRRNGVDARWVFGVRTWPFLAHCWVQVGDRIVGDTLERTGGFTPIMVV